MITLLFAKAQQLIKLLQFGPLAKLAIQSDLLYLFTLLQCQVILLMKETVIWPNLLRFEMLDSLLYVNSVCVVIFAKWGT